MIYVVDASGRKELLWNYEAVKASEDLVHLHIEVSNGPVVESPRAKLLGKAGYEPSRGQWGKWFLLFQTRIGHYLAVITGEVTKCWVCMNPNGSHRAWAAFGDPFWANRVFEDAKMKPPTTVVE